MKKYGERWALLAEVSEIYRTEEFPFVIVGTRLFTVREMKDYLKKNKIGSEYYDNGMIIFEGKKLRLVDSGWYRFIRVNV